MEKAALAPILALAITLLHTMAVTTTLQLYTTRTKDLPGHNETFFVQDS
jgi:hypothetical protein